MLEAFSRATRFAVVLELFCLLGMAPAKAGVVGVTTRRDHPPANRPMGEGPARFVDAARGDDSAAGNKQAPWKSVQHAVRQLSPGDTLYLRGGTYYENVYIVPLRSYPGEVAILDGVLIEFFETPARAWEPVAGGAKDEYRSARAYPNLRYPIGSLGESMIGLNTYYHAKDLRADSQRWDFERPGDRDSDVKPVYCGPGVWYDSATGAIHVRLSHTDVPGVENYHGSADPRRTPLVIAAFASIPLTLDGARHVCIQDLVIRGGGYDTVVVNQGTDLEFDNVTVYCGSYGMRIARTERLHLHHSALHGNVPPWTFRTDTSLRAYPARPHRDLTRLNTHALLVPDAGREYSIYAVPINDDWEISHCEFTGGHDGLYLGGVSLKFHHNVLHEMHDDGIYLSPMYPRYSPRRAELHLYQNYLAGCLTALAFGGPEKESNDTVYFYRNIVDLRQDVPTGRPASGDEAARQSTGKVIGDHGSPPWSAMNIYHNTFVMSGSRTADMVLQGAANPQRPRRVFNNILLHLDRLPALSVLPVENGQADGNLYWSPAATSPAAEAFFNRYRSSPAFEQSKAAYPPGFTTNSLVAEPQFIRAQPDAEATNDYRLQPTSPAINAGVPIPGEWPDPLRAQDAGHPDLGAMPLGSEPFQAGRE
jgi:hypothetical protein